ncbi:hypothetical protein F2Q70_00002263 [Brassica cretica]|uniref:DUF223 domain-containing protein n=1 Tax=Brassica cretica TaxID=69181 RepID=A0A8S9INK7_BRACR|nr:hypothetical protein F2Q70_00002263 [Brassica cretica]
MLGGQWCFIENFGLTPATGKYRATSHRYKLSIIGSSLVTSSSLKIDGSFLSLTPYESIINGSLDSNFLIDYNDEDSHANALSFEMTSGQISLLSNENEDGTCSASTPLSKRSGDNQIDDLASTTKKHCSKAIKMEKKIKVEKIEGE